MKSITISSHIPDIDLITSFAERNSGFLSGVSPWTKLIVLMYLVLLITIIPDLPVLVVIYLLVLFLFPINYIPLRYLLLWYWIPLVFVISLIGILMWSEPGHPVVIIPLIIMNPVLTDTGLHLLGMYLMKALITFTYSILFLMTTRYAYLAGMISRIFPAPIDQIFLMAYRFIFLTLSTMKTELKAVQCRGGGLLSSFRKQSRLFAEIAGLTFIRSFERAERVNRAMMARGNNAGSYGSHTPVPYPSRIEYIFLILGAIIIIGAIVEYSDGGGLI